MIRARNWLRFGALEENNTDFCRVASLLMPLSEAEFGDGIKIDVTKEVFP